MLDKDPSPCAHLLTMSAGLGSDRAPGVTFRRSDSETELVSAILRRSPGNPSMSWLRKKLFAPLGITDVEWSKSPGGVAVSNAGLNLRPRDWAKSASLFSTMAFGKVSRSFRRPGWINRRLSKSRPTDRSLMAISGGLADHWTGTTRCNGSPRVASIPKRPSSSPRVTWWSSQCVPPIQKPWWRPSWISWIDTSCRDVKGLILRWRRPAHEVVIQSAGPISDRLSCSAATR